MRRLLLARLHPEEVGSLHNTGHQSDGDSAVLNFFVYVLVLPGTLATCASWSRLWRWRSRRWHWDWRCRCFKSSEDAQDAQNTRNSFPQPSTRSSNGAATSASQGSTSQNDTRDATQLSTTTTDGPMHSAKPGQPANQVSLPTRMVGDIGHRTDTPKAAPGPSYESDDDEGGRLGTAEGRLNDITRSVKSHANAAGLGSQDEAARRQAEDAANRLAAERSLLPHDDAKGTVVTASGEGFSGPPAIAPADINMPQLPTASPGMLAPAAAPEMQPAAGGEACGATQPMAACDIDLDIDLARGDLKVDYSPRGLLGQGGFAAVYKGRYKGQRVAVKMIKKTAGSSLTDLQEDMNALMHELHILRQVNHPNIVTLYGGCLKPPRIFLVEERMEGTLDFYVHQVRKHDALSVREVVYFALDIACGLSYLHPRIVHRDLKPANVLLSHEGRCKISDFGLARTKIKEYLSTKNLDAGTTAYIAPECFMSMDNPDMHDLRRSVTDRTDIYALGIIMWEMLAGKRPWQGLKPLLVAYQVAYRSLRPPLFELGPRCPPKLRQLIEECWCQESKQRPSSQQVVDRLLDILNELPPELDDLSYPQQQAPALPRQQLAALPAVVTVVQPLDGEAILAAAHLPSQQ
ncbi:hypothetical protein VaNZ11_012713 [Volvox africanus]|uniref:Protein kinase domain-containing protein n=1 Tax=Volvox africanus TaxID=51714 RepID=A0ABQ5SEP0_9CHLO|nr:hypothetical protein VaNZ11_012713 [Volvox africanus]